MGYPPLLLPRGAPPTAPEFQPWTTRTDPNCGRKQVTEVNVSEPPQLDGRPVIGASSGCKGPFLASFHGAFYVFRTSAMFRHVRLTVLSCRFKQRWAGGVVGDG
jgi:hypothetical protein